MLPDILSELQPVVEEDKRWNIEWYSWLIRVTEALFFHKGTATFAASTTVAVTLPRAEPNTDYGVWVGGPADNYYWIPSKTTTGFTIQAKNSNSDTVWWWLRRF